MIEATTIGQLLQGSRSELEQALAVLERQEAAVRERIAQSEAELASCRVLRRFLETKLHGPKARKKRKGQPGPPAAPPPPTRGAEPGPEKTAEEPATTVRNFNGLEQLVEDQIVGLLEEEGSLPVTAIGARLKKSAAFVGNVVRRSSRLEAQHGEVSIRKGRA